VFVDGFRRAFVAASVVWAALLPIAPFAASQPAPAGAWYALAFLVYGIGSVICHQLPERSFELWSAQLPVCARCTGIYAGAAIAAIIAGIIRPKPDPTSEQTIRRRPDPTYAIRARLAAAALPTVLTLGYEWTTGDAPSNVVRAVSGAPLGAAVALTVMELLRATPVARSAGKVN
jgi:hypothetical protein